MANMASLESLILPFDVLAEIIRHSDLETDIPTLRALSMTCRAIVEPSQRRLFNIIKILVIPFYHKKTQPIYSTLNEIFNSSPHLATYVNHLTIKFQIPYPDTSCIVPALKKLSLIQSLRIENPNWTGFAEESPQWREVINAILCHPSLRRLDLEDCGLLPSIVWQLPALTSIDIAGWRIEDPDVSLARPNLTRRMAMLWDGKPDSCSTLRSFLKISPRLAHLKVTHYGGTYFTIINTEINNDLTTIISRSQCRFTFYGIIQGNHQQPTNPINSRDPHHFLLLTQCHASCWHCWRAQNTFLIQRKCSREDSTWLPMQRWADQWGGLSWVPREPQLESCSLVGVQSSLAAWSWNWDICGQRRRTNWLVLIHWIPRKSYPRNFQESDKPSRRGSISNTLSQQYKAWRWHLPSCCFMGKICHSYF